MAINDNFEFKRNGGSVKFERGKGKDVDKTGFLGIKGNKLKDLDPIFDAILKLDGKGNKLDSDREVDLMNKLQRIFELNDGNKSKTVVDQNDLNLGKEFKKLKKEKGKDYSIEMFLDAKLSELERAELKQGKVVREEVKKEQPVKQDETVVVNQEKETVVEEEKVSKPKISENAYNQTIQNMKIKYNAQDLGFNKTVKVAKGDNLTKIAIAALEADGVEKPNNKQINERIAQIAAANNITNINNIKIGVELYVGTTEGVKGVKDGVKDIKEEKGIKAEKKERVEQSKVKAEQKFVPVEKPEIDYLDPNKLTELIGADGSKYAEAVKGKPEIQQKLAAVAKYLIDKDSNDEYLTLDEQKVLSMLNNYVIEKDGNKILAKAAVAEVKDADGNVTTPASAEVFAQTMKVSSDGKAYWVATYNNKEYRSSDSEILQGFLADLKAADTDAKKTSLFKEVSTLYNDPELLASVLEHAEELKADKADVKALIEKSNLDVVLAKPILFADSEVQKEISDAINQRIKAVMDDPELKKLPENAKYFAQIQDISIPAESTPIKTLADTTGWTETEEEVTVGEGENAVKVIVTKRTKEGEADGYVLLYRSPIDASENYLSASSKEELLKLKQELDALALTHPEEGKTLTAEQKRENLEKLIKIAEIRPTVGMLKHVAEGLNNSNLIDKNDPDAKALAQKLLLTRNADVVRSVGTYDIVGLKTCAAMYKEILAKENAGKKLSDDEIALKEALHDEADSYVQNYSRMITYNIDNGDFYATPVGVKNPQLGQDFNSAWEAAGDDSDKQKAVISRFINDPRVKEDGIFIRYLASNRFNYASPTDQKAIIEMSDAGALWRIKVKEFAGEEADKQATREAYLAKAKELFKESVDTLDPFNARYLKEILSKISWDLAYPDDQNRAKAEADVASILDSFFVIEGEGENQTAKLKDFRRFTYEEMEGLAKAVRDYGSEAQEQALLDVITLEELRNGHFADAIESWMESRCRDKLGSLVEKITTKEEVLDFIGNIDNLNNIPFDKILEKFGDDPEVCAALLSTLRYCGSAEMSDENRIKLAKSVMQVDDKGNITFDKSKLPDGVSVQNVIVALPAYCNAEEAAKLYKAIFMNLDLQNEDIILLMNVREGTFDSEMMKKIEGLIKSDEVKKRTKVGNEFVDCLAENLSYSENKKLFDDLYNIVSPAKKKDLIKQGCASDDHVLVNAGDSIDKIVKRYLRQHLDKFPRLKESIESDKEKWTEARIDEALNDYMNDFRKDIMNDLGISDPTKLKAGSIVELSKVNWEKHQPSWLNYNLTY